MIVKGLVESETECLYCHCYRYSEIKNGNADMLSPFTVSFPHHQEGVGAWYG